MSVTQIEWTKRPGTIGETWNPTTGCNKVDRGCKHCYALTMHRRLQAMGQAKYKAPFLDGAKCHPDTLSIPYGWRKPRTVFVNSMSDLFHEDVPFEFISDVFKVMDQLRKHTFLILTKRPKIALQFQNWNKQQFKHWQHPANVWLGTSCNDQKSAEIRVPLLLQLECKVRFLSYEPATGPVDLTCIKVEEDDTLNVLAGTFNLKCSDNEYQLITRLNWVIMGGESGKGAEPMHPAWARKVRDDCAGYNVPFFFKQWGAWEPHTYFWEGKPFISEELGKNEYLFTHPVPQNMKRATRKDNNVLDCVTHQEFPW